MKKPLAILTVVFGIITQFFGQDYPDDYLCEKHLINSTYLNQEHLVFVYLPSNYTIDTTLKYPVHFVADAPLTSNLYSDLLKLHALSTNIPQGIVVGISSDNRNKNLHPEKNADKYLDFIEYELIPLIQKTYRVENFKVLAGHSLSGDFTLYTLLKRPNLFDAYIAGSPGPIDPILRIAQKEENIALIDKDKFLYTSIGSNDQTDSVSFTQLKNIIGNNASEKFENHFIFNKDQDHFSNLAINFQNGIKLLYTNWKYQLPDLLVISASQSLNNHYDNLEAKFGYRPQINEWNVIFPIMHQLAIQGDFKNAIDILNYCIEIYPESDQAYAFLAKAYFDTGNFDNGKKCLEKSLELNPQNEFAIQIKMMLENK